MKVNSFFSNEAMDALGWTFMHSLWQGLMLMIVLATLLVVLRRFSASTKYTLSVSFLFFFLASCAVTFFVVYEPPHIAQNTTKPENNVVVPVGTSEALNHDSEEEIIAGQIDAITARTPFYARLDAFFPVIVTFWFLGITLLSIRYLGSCIYLLRLRNRKVKSVDSYWKDKSLKLGQKLNLSKKFLLRFSDVVTTPMVIGFFRPVILLPVHVITQLPEKQIEAILVHELAHIRRNDYLVNIIQSLMEVVFFYHPAVWLISARIRTERENCCDDLTVSVIGETVNYAEALVNVGRVEMQTNLSLAFSGNKDSLKERVQRMFTPRTLFADFRERMVTVVVIVLGICSLGWSMLSQSNTAIISEESGSLELQENKLINEGIVDDTSFGESNGREAPGSASANEGSKANEIKTSAVKVVEKNEPKTKDERNEDDDTSTGHSLSLVEAVQKGSIDAVQSLLKKGTNIESKDRKGRTPLFLAVKNNNYDLARLLVNNGANVTFIQKGGRSLLMEASDEEDHRLAQLLLKNGVDVNYQTKGNPSALFEAIENGNTEVVNILLKEGADMEQKDKKERTALMYAVGEEEHEIALMLLKAGADVNASTNDGWTVLMESCAQKNPSTVKMLINWGANVKAISYHNITALNTAVRKERLEIVKVLLEFGADVNWRYDKLTPLCEAVRRNNYEMTKLLIEGGADIQARESDRGETVLIQAADEKDPRIVELLLQKGADANSSRYDARTAIFEAIEGGRIANAKALIKYGADINWQKHNDMTPLMYAIEKKKLGMVILLVENGANTLATRGNGWSVLQMAERSGHSEIINYISSHIK